MLSKYLEMKFREIDLNQSQIARRLGTSRSLVNAWIRGKSTPSFESCCKIAKLLAKEDDRKSEEILAEMSRYIEDEYK